MDLFAEASQPSLDALPLATRFTPASLTELVGQEHLTAPGKLLSRTWESGAMFSAIFHGPPGSGKTALARLFAKKTKAYFIEINAASSSVEDLRKAIATAKQKLTFQGERTLLFVDEIHHFNRRQQDALLPDVEKGTVTLIGNTTENPFFSIITPLLSRVQLFEFKPLETKHIVTILKRALADQERGLGKYQVDFEERALEHLAVQAGGDARRALNSLEVGIISSPPEKGGIINFDLRAAEESIQKKMIRYDRSGDEHYNVISAFIKSMRGGACDAVLYWLAKMLEAGEDPRFIARRIAICAAEDVGNADPQALLVAAAAFDLVEKIGLPEGRIILSQAALYVAAAPKSNSVIIGIDRALADVRKGESLEVPDHLKDPHRPNKTGAKYKYPHSFPGNFVRQVYLSKKADYYRPSENGYEKVIRERLKSWWNPKRGKTDEEHEL